MHAMEGPRFCYKGQENPSGLPTLRDLVRDRNSFVKAPRPASGADFGVAIAFMWRIAPRPVDMMTNTAPHDPVQASAGAREDQPLSLWAASGDVGNRVNPPQCRHSIS